MKPNLDKVPTTFIQALGMLLDALTDEDRAYLKSKGADGSHFGVGMWLRNNWSLWEPQSPLPAYFREKFGLGHADDMSGLLMECVARTVRGEPLRLKEQIEHYRKHWLGMGVDPKTQMALAS